MGLNNPVPASLGLQALFGGTFDPIHYGHLRPVEMLAKTTGLAQVILLPNHVPPHRPQPEASAQQRVAMVELAIQNNSLFSLDTRELARETPSYTLDTLRELRHQLGHQQPLAFIIGQDSLLSINTWYQWEELLQNCHLLVCARPGYATRFAQPEMQQWLETHQTRDPAQLSVQPHGLIFLADTPLINISATEIRNRLHAGDSCADLLPPAVLRYIRQHSLYQD